MSLESISERLRPFATDADLHTFDPTPLLTLGEFFDGNEVTGSIWCNIFDPERPDWAPEPALVRRTLEEVAARPEVDELRIAVGMWDDPDWPFSDTVWVTTTADDDTIRSWFDDLLAPSDIVEPSGRVRYEDLPIAPGHRVALLWWD